VTITTVIDGPRVLDNGARVLFYTEQHPGGNGFRRHGVVAAFWREEFVTWRVYVDDDNNWQAESGNYYKEVMPALENYVERGGKNGEFTNGKRETV
jgi:hypothetical protein